MASTAIVRASLGVVVQIVSLELQKILKRKKRKHRWWVRKWISRRSGLGASNTLIQELSQEDQEAYFNHLRMTQDKFAYLLNRISNKIQKSDTHMRDAIPARLKLQVTLRFLASGDSFASLQYTYRIPKCTISKFICEVLDAIYEALKDYLRTPRTEDEWNEVERGFAIRWNFPGCIGAIDGKHVMIKCPQKSGSTFYNYKGTFSTILLALVDSNYCFTYLDVGAAGRESDGGVFSRSNLKTAIEEQTINKPNNFIIVGDDAFPLKTYLLKPYSRSGPLTFKQKIFNYCLSRARRIVENAFGIVVSKFRIFEKPISLAPDKVDKIVLACCALHNWLRKTSPATYFTPALIDTENLENGEILPGRWREIPTNGLHDVENIGSHNHTREAALTRDRYADYFITEGKIPWQNAMI